MKPASIPSLAGRRLTIMGLGTHGGGVAAARFCAKHGARVTVTDLADANALPDSIHALSDIEISGFVLGRHDEDCFRDADVVVVNPAVRPGNRFVELARDRGAAITSEAELFLNACPAKVIAVTGTVGKSTTAAMLAAIFCAAGRRAWLGGNIGNSLLADLPQMRADEIVVLELSSFQLHWLSEQARWPFAAVVTNCSPNHLDWHGNWSHYRACKQRLIEHLPRDGFCIIGASEGDLNASQTQTRRIEKWPLNKLPPLAVPGEHNQLNAACAAAAAADGGVDEATIRQAVSQFKGLPHRLQFVAEIAGRRFYNDSKSTYPAATIAALNAMDRPAWLLLGGAKCQADLSSFISEVVDHAAGVDLFGKIAPELENEFQRIRRAFPVVRAATLSEAFVSSWEHSNAGEAILLSPGFPSIDQFRDFAHRGRRFEELVHNLASAGHVTC